jgi:hypothetical protein
VARRIVVIAAFLLGGPVSAQTLRGRVVDAGTTSSVVGAHVMLLDAAGRTLRSVLTNEQGRFQIRAPAAGDYRLRVEMIGRSSTTSEVLAIAAGDARETTLELALAPVSLPGLDVRSSERCELRSAASGDVVTVWEEARKALAVEAAVRGQRIFRFDLVRYERHYDETLRTITRENQRHMSRASGDPFVSVPAEQLAREGYRERRDDDWFLHGPTGDVLLSQSFLDTHCFFLRRDRDRQDRIGLAFEPVPQRKLTDVEGVLWLDARSAELRTLEFRYTEMPPPFPRGAYGGNVEFQRLPNGAFIVRKWEIYSPILGRNDQMFGGRRIGGERVVGRFVDGGEVLNIFARDGSIIDTTPRATLAGMVWDSTAGRPAAGAEVFIVGTAVTGRTDALGRFRLSGLASGRFAAAFRYTSPDSITFEVAPRPIELVPGQVTELPLGTLRMPTGVTANEMSRRDTLSRVGRAIGYTNWDLLVRPQGDSAILGRMGGVVLDSASGRAIAGARVIVRGALLADFTLSVMTRRDGTFRPLDLLPGEYEVIAEHTNYVMNMTRVQLEPAQSLVLNVHLGRDDSAAALRAVLFVTAGCGHARTRR